MPYRAIAERLGRSEIACRIKLHQIRRREEATARSNSNPRRRPRAHRRLPPTTETAPAAEAGPSGLNSRAPSSGQSSPAQSTGAAAGSSPAPTTSASGQTVTPLTPRSIRSDEEVCALDLMFKLRRLTYSGLRPSELGELQAKPK